jgi:hypothetical protein
MIKYLILSSILLTSPVFAQEQQKSYRPFTYTTPCAVETPSQFVSDVCTVVETRETGGALRSRNIYSNRFKLTIKSWFDKKRGFMTWDSHNKFEYKWEYKVGSVDGMSAWTSVMPGVFVQNVSWD